MKPGETVASFVDRFEYLCYRCGDLSPSNSALFDAFLKAMTPKFSEKLDIDLPQLFFGAFFLERNMSTFCGLLTSSPSVTYAPRRRNHG
ncbi:hypothetical protein A0J61_05572 [Choanephora cucurbitarum]|uniref:Retrotransposon gag domain-containing protein n=1 Tax=Choanephora cucurbitarum TaxID=101091 RepID=A0A1C7NBL6_9FUNG|nr:hypothetical protein A0J61_05572 [Choanephora cucurbitarum]